MGKQIGALTSTRGIAAVMVVIFHFGRFCFPGDRLPIFFYHGALAVGYFFVLSGFVLYIAYEGKRISYPGYIKGRMARIIPIYEVALLLIVCVNYFIYRSPFSFSYIKLMIIHGLLLQSYIPDYAMNLNIQAWTLSVEMCFYILFPLLLIFFNRSVKFFVIFTILLYVVSQAVHLHYYPLRHNLGSNIVDTVFFSPIIHLNQFLIGMCGGYLYRKTQTFHNTYRWLLVFCCVITLAAMCLLPAAISCHTGLIAPVFMLLIVSVSVVNPFILNLRPLIFLGEISYGIYILQMPLGEIFTFVNNKYMHLQAQNSFLCFLCLLTLVAAISFIFFEKPIMKMAGQAKAQIRKEGSPGPEEVSARSVAN